MRIPQKGIGIPWDYRIRTRIQDGSNKDQSHQGMASTHKHSRSPIVPWIHELLQEVCEELLEDFRTNNTVIEERKQVRVGRRSEEGLSRIKGSIHTGKSASAP